jgi:hypothetical protein
MTCTCDVCLWSILFQCPICDDVILENNIQLIIHLCRHFNQQQQTNNSLHSPFEHINTKCSFCQSEFSNPYFLAMHIDDKHLYDISEYSCRICDDKHSSLYELMKHLNAFHGGLDMPYSCQICSFRTSIYADMIYHMDEIHKGTRFFLCPYCFMTIELPLTTMNSSTMLNGTLAYQHLAMHSTSNEHERTSHTKYQHCQRCLLHVPSLKEHLQRDHSSLPDSMKIGNPYRPCK